MQTVPFPNWFAHYAEGFFNRHLSALVGQASLRFLQIGAFTGDASLWLLDNVLTGMASTLTDVDTWAGSDEPEHEPFDFRAVEALYDERTAEARHCRRLGKYKGTSEAFFTCALRDAEDDDKFDFIYIDGDHTAYTVLNDAVASYRLLRPGGLLAFDDYLWKSGRGDAFDPGPAIDAVASIYEGRLQLIQLGLQAWFRKMA